MSGYQEMLPADIFTRPRGWQAKIQIKYLLTDEEDLTPEQINKKGKTIAAILKNCPSFDDGEIITNFEGVDDLDEFNSILDDLYDYCDTVRIWVG